MTSSGNVATRARDQSSGDIDRMLLASGTGAHYDKNMLAIYGDTHVTHVRCTCINVYPHGTVDMQAVGSYLLYHLKY